MGPPKKDDISREKTILMTSLRTHRTSAVRRDELYYTYPPLPPSTIERSVCTISFCIHHILADFFLRGNRLYKETVLFCIMS